MEVTSKVKLIGLLAWFAGMAMVGAAAAQEPLKIGAINPYSGPLALYGDEMARGYQIAVNERNAKGGVLGRKIELVRGDATNPQQAIAAVDQLATRDKVEIFVGTYVSAIANAGSDAALRHQRLWWDTNALGAELTERKLANFVRSGPNGSHFAEVSVRAVIEMIAPALGKKPNEITVALEHEDSIYGKTIADVQKARLEEKGVKVVGVGAHNFRAADPFSIRRLADDVRCGSGGREHRPGESARRGRGDGQAARLVPDGIRGEVRRQVSEHARLAGGHSMAGRKTGDRVSGRGTP